MCQATSLRARVGDARGCGSRVMEEGRSVRLNPGAAPSFLGGHPAAPASSVALWSCPECAAAAWHACKSPGWRWGLKGLLIRARGVTGPSPPGARGRGSVLPGTGVWRVGLGMVLLHTQQCSKHSERNKTHAGSVPCYLSIWLPRSGHVWLCLRLSSGPGVRGLTQPMASPGRPPGDGIQLLCPSAGAGGKADVGAERQLRGMRWGPGAELPAAGLRHQAITAAN